MNKFIKYVWQLIISASNATLEVPHYTPVIKSQKNWEQLERTLKIEKKKN